MWESNTVRQSSCLVFIIIFVVSVSHLALFREVFVLEGTNDKGNHLCFYQAIMLGVLLSTSELFCTCGLNTEYSAVYSAAGIVV